MRECAGIPGALSAGKQEENRFLQAFLTSISKDDNMKFGLSVFVCSGKAVFIKITGPECEREE